MSVLARDLGARGSRGQLAGPDPAAALPPKVRDVLAGAASDWQRRAHACGLRGRWSELPEAFVATAPVPLDGAAHAPPAVHHDPGFAYVASLEPGLRARHGRHYTPPLLAEHLWGAARTALGAGAGAQVLPGLVRDPACGAGALLLPPLREHLRAARRADPELVLAGLPHLVEGIDTDPAAVWLANLTLTAEALPLLAAVPPHRRRPWSPLAHLGDGLAEREARARVLVMNPPYGRVRLSVEERARFAHVLFGHPNLYALFLASALEALDERGVLAALVPTSFTSGRYFMRLRGVLAATAPLRDLTFVADRDGTFAGVVQETCVGVFLRGSARGVSTIGRVQRRRSAVATVPTPQGEAPWFLPRHAGDARIAAAAAELPLTLGTAGWRVSTGPLVWNRRADDLHAHAAPGRVRVLWGGDVTMRGLERDERRDHQRFLQLRGPADRTMLVLDAPALLVQRTTSPEQTRRLVVAELDRPQLDSWGGAVVVENHVNVLRPAGDRPLLSQRALGLALATPTLDRVLRCLSGSVAVSAYELEHLPLPDASVLTSWQQLAPDELPCAVAAAYGG